MIATVNIVHLYNAITASETAADSVKVFVEALAPLGMDKLAAGEADLADKDLVVFFAMLWPECWRHFYLSSGFLERDPIIQSIPLYGSRPLTWTDPRRDRSVAKLGTKALELPVEAGRIDCLTVPLPRGGTRYGFVTLAGSPAPLIRAIQFTKS